MKLADLNPELRDNGPVLMFDCPCGKHSMRIPIAAESAYKNKGVWWVMTGELPNITLRNPNPSGQHSVDASPCFHLTVTNGEMK